MRGLSRHFLCLAACILLILPCRAQCLSGEKRQAFVSTIRATIRQGISDLFPKGYKTLSIDANFAGRSHDGKRKQVIKDSKGKTHTLFVRIFYEGMSEAKRKRVIAVTKSMGDLWGGPDVLWYHPDNRVMITSFVETQMPVQAYFKKPENLRAFVQRLKKSHEQLKGSGLSFTNVSLHVRAKRRLRELCDVMPELKERLSKAQKFLDNFKESENDIVHGDMQASNIIIDDKPHLLDWTEASRGDVFEDLGGLSVHLKFTPAQKSQLLEDYFGSVCSKDLEKLARYGDLNRVHAGCFALREGWKQLKKAKAKLPPGKYGLAQNLLIREGMTLLAGFLD